jgi:carbonic anhydrase
MPKFAAGVVKFQKDIYPQKKELFERLSKGQSPEALFIACSDSRVETSMITQTEPGELFVCRNAGNIVPPHTTYTGGMTASIEFAMQVLNVPHIVICGHTHCGAMQGAMKPESVKNLPHVKEWLSYASAAVDITNEIAAKGTDAEKIQTLTEQNVILQMQHLRTHPSVALRLAKKELVIHGWVYDIKTGEVAAYDDVADKFIPVSDKYAAEIASLAIKHSC